RELLLDCDREVGHLLERRPRGGQQLLVPDLLRVAHPAEAYPGASGSRSRSATRVQLQLRSTARRAASPSCARSGSTSSSRRRSRSASASPFGNEVRCASAGGYSAAIPAATSARPECAATTGGTPAAAASAATMPNASGKIDGTTETSA